MVENDKPQDPDRRAWADPGRSQQGGLPEPAYGSGDLSKVDELIRALDLLSGRLARSENRIRSAVQPLEAALARIEAQLDKEGAPPASGQKETSFPGAILEEEAAPPTRTGLSPDPGRENDDRNAERPDEAAASAVDRAPRVAGRGRMEAARTSRRHMSLEKRFEYFSNSGPAEIEEHARPDEGRVRASVETGERPDGTRYLFLVTSLLASAGIGFWVYSSFVSDRLGNDEMGATLSIETQSLPAELSRLADPASLSFTPLPPEMADMPLPVLTRTARIGDSWAAVALGVMYARGLGVELDYASADEWFRVGIEHGSRDAKYNLAVLHARMAGNNEAAGEQPAPAGQGRILAWLREAARDGQPQASVALALMALANATDPESLGSAVDVLERTARKGHADAALALGRVYLDGLGTPAAPEDAYVWFSLAALAGNQAAVAGAGLASGRLDAAGRERAEARVSRWSATFLPQNEIGGNGVENDGEKDSVLETEQLLDRLRISPGPVDGRMTEETRAAIRTYQGYAGLPETGEISPALLTHLRAVSGVAPPEDRGSAPD